MFRSTNTFESKIPHEHNHAPVRIEGERLTKSSAASAASADAHHIELHGFTDALKLAELEGSQRLTNAIHMIGRHMGDRVDVKIEQSIRSQS